MPDYKELYLHMMRQTELAIRILIETQRDCEGMILNAPEEPSLIVLDSPPEGDGGGTE